MISTSAEYKVSIAKRTKRRTYGKVNINYTDPFVDQSIVVAVSSEGPASYKKQVADGIYEPTHNWFPLDGTAILDGSFVLMPPTSDVISALSMQVGWWSGEVAGVGGAFAAPQLLTVVFVTRSLELLFVASDSIKNEYPVDFTIKLYDIDNVLLYTKTVTANTLVYWTVTIAPVAAVVKQVLSITKWSHAGRCAKVYEFFTSIIREYLSDEIFSMELLEERESDFATIPVGNISSNQITIKLFNLARQFDYGSLSAIANLVKPMRKINPYIGADGDIPELIAYWSMDDVPEIPTATGAALTYLQDAWATVDGWATMGTDTVVSVAGGELVLTKGAAPATFVRANKALAVSSKTVRLKWRCAQTDLTTLEIGTAGAGTRVTKSIAGLTSGIVDITTGANFTDIEVLFNSTGNNANPVYIDWIYVGTGAYLANSLIDNSGNSNHGTIYGATPVAGISGKALAFDGINDRAVFEAPSFNITGDYSIAFWASQSATAGTRCLFRLGSGASLNGIYTYVSAGSSSYRLFWVRAGAQEEGGAIAMSSALQAHSVTYVASTKTWTIYRNGIFISSGVLVNTPVPPTNVGQIGSYSTIDPFPGIIDEFRIYNRALSASEIAGLANMKPPTVIEWIPLGTFWSHEWNIPDDDIFAETVGLDILALMTKTDYIPGFLVNKTLYEIILAIVQDYGLLSGMYYIDPDLDIEVIPYANIDKTNHREALRIAVEAGSASAFVNRMGILRIEGPNYLNINSATSIKTIQASEYFMRKNPSRYSTINNVVKVNTSPLVPDSAQTSVYNESLTIPAGTAWSVSAIYTEKPCISALALLVAPPGGVSITSATYYSWGADIIITNANVVAEIAVLNINATVLRNTGSQTAIARDETSIIEFGKKVYIFPDNPLVQDYQSALRIANQVLSTYSSARRDLSQSWRGDPAIELSDKITTDASRTAIDDYWIIRQTLSWDGTLRASHDGAIVPLAFILMSEDGYLLETEDSYLMESE